MHAPPERPSEAPAQGGLERLVVDSLTTAVLVLDAKLRVLALNPAAEALLDLSGGKVRGRALGELFPQARIYARLLARALALGQPITERALTLRLAGRSVTVDCSVTPIEDARAALVVELVDLGHHRRAAREAHLLTQNQSVRALVRGLAHEIRNPLGGLRGAAQLLDRELVDESLTEYTRIIIHEADRLESLLARMLGPRGPVRRREANVHQITERVYALVAAEAPPGVRVERDYDPSIPTVVVDPEAIIQATLNVARNAVQAVGDRGRVVLRTRVQRQVTIGTRRHRLAVSIDVVDDGPGVPESLAENIFYPMVSGHPQGSGLGLSIAQSIAGSHGGLVVFSRVAGETVFSILVPLEGNP